MKSIIVQANAKINLDLKILKKRADGFHQIKSIFQSIDLSDFLLFEESTKDIFTGAIICPTSENIIFKTKRIVENSLRKSLPCKIHLQKSIPIAAGLGGESADAAATLVGLNLLYNLNLSKKELLNIAIKVGSDVPFFLYGGTCEVKGIGERVKKIRKNLPKFFILFRPHQRIETKEVYKIYDKNKKNFLEINRELCPEVKKVENYLLKFNLKPKLSGSGPTVFIETNNHQFAQKVTGGYPQFNGDIFICRPKPNALSISNNNFVGF